MLHTDARFLEAVEAAVTEIEAGTDAEVVVVAAPRSGSYRDVPLSLGLAVGAAVIAIAAWSPLHISATWIPLDLAVAVALSIAIGGRWPTLIRALTSAERRQAQVLAAAHAAFFEEQVHGTRNRSGVLIYVSALEGVVEVIPDHGLDARIPRARWNRIQWDATDLDPFVAGLRACGEVLAEGCPALEDNPNEIPNAPRIRS